MAGRFPTGSELLVRYAGVVPVEHHARIVLAPIGGDGVIHDHYFILNPDGDQYGEDYGTGNRDVHSTAVRPADRSVPPGIPRASVYDFAALPSDAELKAMMDSAARDAFGERRRLGVAAPVVAVVQAQAAAPAAAVVLPLADGGGGLGGVVPGGGLVPGGAIPPGPARGGILRPPPAAPHGFGGFHADDGGDPAVLGRYQHAGGGGLHGGLGALRDIIGGGGASSEVRGHRGVEPAEPAGGQATGDIRILSVLYDVTGERFRRFADAVQHLEAISFADSPVKGPVTIVWCCRFMRDHGGSPTGWHTKWLSLTRMQANDSYVILHDHFSKVLEMMVVYDQLQVGALAAAEYVVRQIQMIEEKYKDKVAGAEDAVEQALFSGQVHRSGLCLCPALSEWMGTEMRGEAALMKERRKAREERALKKPPAGGGAK